MDKEQALCNFLQDLEEPLISKEKLLSRKMRSSFSFVHVLIQELAQLFQDFISRDAGRLDTC